MYSTDPKTCRSEERIYVDLEYCYPGMTHESGRPGEDDTRQIVQIAAIRVDAGTGEELATFDVLTRPVFEMKLPLFFIELTRITNGMVDAHGIFFPEAYQAFVQFCSSIPVWTFHKDWYVLKQNCGYFNIPFTLSPFTTVKEFLPGWGVDSSLYSSGTLHRAAGIEIRGHVHNALHDVRSMAAAVHYFETHVHE